MDIKVPNSGAMRNPHNIRNETRTGDNVYSYCFRSTVPICLLVVAEGSKVKSVLVKMDGSSTAVEVPFTVLRAELTCVQIELERDHTFDIELTCYGK